MQRIAYPFQDLVVELQPPQQLGELRFERLLADVFAPARGRVALALISIAGAMIIDVARLLDLPDYRAAAGMAGDQPGEGEVVPAALGFLGVASVHMPRPIAIVVLDLEQGNVVIDLGILEQPFAGCETAALLKNLQVPDMIARRNP
jgi:hypothetical protein